MAPAWGKVPAFLLPREKQAQQTTAKSIITKSHALATSKPLPAACVTTTHLRVPARLQGRATDRGTKGINAAPVADTFDLKRAGATAEAQVLLPMHGLAVASRTRSLAATAPAPDPAAASVVGCSGAAGDLPALAELSDQKHQANTTKGHFLDHLVGFDHKT